MSSAVKLVARPPDYPKARDVTKEHHQERSEAEEYAARNHHDGRILSTGADTLGPHTLLHNFELKQNYENYTLIDHTLSQRRKSATATASDTTARRNNSLISTSQRTNRETARPSQR